MIAIYENIISMILYYLQIYLLFYLKKYGLGNNGGILLPHTGKKIMSTCDLIMSHNYINMQDTCNYVNMGIELCYMLT